MTGRILSYLSDEEFQRKSLVGCSGDEIERVIQEYAGRGLSEAADEGQLFGALVHARLRELECRYAELQFLFHRDLYDVDELREECLSHIREYFQQPKAESQEQEQEQPRDGSEEEPWPWPTTEIQAVGEGVTTEFGHERSGLNLCGYHTGQRGMLEAERSTFLDWYFSRDLPEVVAVVHDDAYGEPNSSKRLKKMAEVLAGLCRLRKLDDPHRYRVSIGHYETDLAYLKESYYEGRFDWPSPDIE